jgi:superfamily I DNA/RNA helicase
VLAEPGSGKALVLVHRIACLIRMQRGNLRDVLVPACNRPAAVGTRERLKASIGEDAGVAVSTCDALAMQVVGASFAGLRLHRRRRGGPAHGDRLAMAVSSR